MRKTASIILTFIVFSYLGYVSYSLLLSSARFAPMIAPGANSVTVPLLAVTEDNEGMLIPLVVELMPGTGKVLVNINNPSFITDTQDSIRLAVKEAAEMTNTDMKKYDAVFSIKTNISVIGGPSAGAAMTIATMALMLNKHIKDDVAITGTIMSGGYIGQVGGVQEKATAAKDNGMKLVLVPSGESIYREPLENCTQVTGRGYSQKECFITYRLVNISKEVGIPVKEVSTITDALEYMLE